MATQNTFDFDGTKFDVLEYSCAFHRKTNPKGKPDSDVFGGLINFSIQQLETDKKLIEAILTKASDKKGTMTVKDADGEKDLKVVSFEEGYIVNYDEYWHQDGSGMVIKFTVSANKITIDGVNHEHKWPSK